MAGILSIEKLMDNLSVRKRIIIAKEMAESWIRDRSSIEFRVRVYGSLVGNLPNLLRLFRDGRVKLGSVPRIQDLGVEEHEEYVELWSGEEKKLAHLCKWLNSKGLEDTGVW